MKDFGVYPIIITRQWNENQKDLIDKVENNTYEVEETSSYKIIRLPFKQSVRDKVSQYGFLKPLQKLLTLKEIILSNYSIKALPYSNFYEEVRKELNNDSSIKAVIASGRPFQSFSIGHAIKKEFDVLWIPDYRDEWTTHQNPGNLSIVQRILYRMERKSELKWTENADLFITVSDNWASSIHDLIGIRGETILNGYEELQERTRTEVDSKPLLITYAGTLYPSQNTDIFIESCLEILGVNKNSIRIQFIGASVIKSEEERIKKKVASFAQNFSFIDRVPKRKLNQLIESTDILYLTGFENVKGWYPVKLFEYYASGIPVLLCPSDNDVMDEFVKNTNSGFIANSIDECKSLLVDLIEKKKKNLQITCDRNLEFGQQFSRRKQAEKLAKLIIKRTTK
jgi:glycosyltransferase involved in cell wall biosynthesis